MLYLNGQLLIALILMSVAVSGCIWLNSPSTLQNSSNNATRNDTVNVTGEFCGTSTNGQCVTDADCATGGCSGQVCQSKSESPIITTCEYRGCYDAKAYGVSCGCVSGRCAWNG